MRFALLTVAMVGCLLLACADAKSVADYKDVMISASKPIPVATQGTCGGGCSSTAECATSAGDTHCRCVNLVCSITDDCGGGCVSDKQCADWAAGNDKCVCTWALHCELESKVKARQLTQ